MALLLWHTLLLRTLSFCRCLAKGRFVGFVLQKGIGSFRAYCRLLFYGGRAHSSSRCCCCCCCCTKHGIYLRKSQKMAESTSFHGLCLLVMAAEMVSKRVA
uniref:Putative secreted protein n=1 Tax=Anopheles darlingi TaxID=43151 RepID=A0A2M4D9L2_ANODA